MDEVQPSQTYLSRRLLDGHHTAHALLLMGFAFIPCMLYDGPIDTNMYGWAVKWAMDEGIERIGHLGKRIVEHGDFMRLWVGACEEYKRKRRGNH